MGRAPCCSKVGLHRGPWTAREDALLIKYIEAHGEGQWRSLPKNAGLLRCGKSCRLRWMNYLRPDIKRGNITPEEDDLIIRLHALLGNRWSLIAGRLPGRTDNEIKNYWNTHLSKRLRATQGSDPNTHKNVSEPRHEKRQNGSRDNRKKMNNKTSQKIDGRKIMEDKSSYVGDETVKTKIHLPKPVRVTSMVSLTSNGSNTSFETNVSNTTTTTTSASSSQSQVESLNHGGIFDPESIDPENILMDLPWLSNNANMVEENGFDNMMKIGLCEDYVNRDIIEPNDYNRAMLGAQDRNKQFEKLYEEYLELIKADHGQIDGYIEGGGDDEVQLDSFTESFLV
ncbi:hypothetical protein RND81_01G205900 [Saponaria officinalis]|uniref:Uncharacterized protein n=1 Tax=Saponaria officinalis TaxID=3572 RepID=A0AAW1NJW4_SAPOF